MTVDIISQLAILKKIQLFDNEIADFDIDLDLIPEQRAKITSDFEASKSNALTAETEKNEIESSKRSIEDDIEATKEFVKDRETKLHGIKTNKEYQAATKEIANAKRKIATLEDKDLNLMESLEKLNEKMTQLSSELADKESACTKAIELIKAEETELLAKKENLAKQREALYGDLDKSVFTVYNRIHQLHSDVVATVESGICSGCSMKVQPQLIIELQKYKHVVQCNKCSRILIMPTKGAETTDNTGASA